MEDQILMKYNISEVTLELDVDYHLQTVPAVVARLLPTGGGGATLQAVQGGDALAVCWLILLCNDSPHHNRSERSHVSRPLRNTNNSVSGYGHSTPKTMWGRLFTMVYALFGIPLGLVLFNSIGKFDPQYCK